jgi:hypothetical protein
VSLENLTKQEMELLTNFRARKQMQATLTDEERALLDKGADPGRRYKLEDLDPSNWKNLSEAERAECQRQVAEAVAAAQRGE